MTTHVTRLTAPAKAAIAALALRGPAAWSIARQVFQPRRGALPEEPDPGRFWLGTLGPDLGEEALLVVRRAAPACEIELHCHGGMELVRAVESLCIAAGAKPVAWPQFVTDGALHERLAQAQTTRIAAIQAGILHAVVGGIQRVIEHLHQSVPVAFEVFLTGGDAERIASRLHRPLHLWPEMTLEGILHSRKRE